MGLDGVFSFESLVLSFVLKQSFLLLFILPLPQNLLILFRKKVSKPRVALAGYSGGAMLERTKLPCALLKYEKFYSSRNL